MLRKIIYTSFIIFLIIGIAAFGYINRNIPLTQSVPITKEIKLDSILTNNENIELYKKFDSLIEKAIQLNGTIISIQNKEGEFTLVLSSNNKNVNIICKMQKDQIKEIKKLKNGDQVAIKGIYKGYLIDMILLNCIII